MTDRLPAIDGKRVWLPIAATLLVFTGCGPHRFPWPLEAGHEQAAVQPAEVQTLNQGYDRLSSRVLVRKISRPTRANLDYAAYHANVMTLNPEPKQATPPAAGVPSAAKLFDGVLVPGSIVASIDQTPLSSAERKQPVAYSPLVDFLSRWDYAQAGPLDEARTAVRAESWGGRKSIQLTSQEITELYRHASTTDPGGEQWWVKIEFAPWARLFTDMPDEDGDGVPEMYGCLKPKLVTKTIVDQTNKEYAGKLLDAVEVKTWINELASYWYPSYNTDVFDMGANTVWPLVDTEAEVTAELSGLKVENPSAVMRGKPRGKAVYNVFVIEGLKPVTKKPAAGEQPSTQERHKRTLTVLLEPQKKLLAEQLAKFGAGSWKKWAARVARYRRRMSTALAKRPKRLKALVGRDGFLFFRNSINYVVGGDLQKQSAGKNPFPTIVDFKNYLEKQGVDFLLVPIPTKIEVFPDKMLQGKFDLGTLPVLNPYGRKLLSEFTDAGVEVVDLLPAYLAARAARKKGEEFLYQPQDTHWTDRGLRLAARMIAARIEKYPWYAELSKKAVAYKQEKVTFKRQGDLVSRLAEREKVRYKPDTLVGHRVIDPAGKPYDDDPQSPIVVLGDSFTGVFERTYCRNAGVSAHIARLIKYPVDLVMSYGGGPNVRRKLLRRGEEALRSKRLVIWMFAARDLYDYWEDWEPLSGEKPGG
ncbi:MAG TPA: hypothetical protein VM425_06005 [Myxococcota bacterium]|nr:hypothetical protein [Myxococcota bacterium]